MKQAYNILLLSVSAVLFLSGCSLLVNDDYPRLKYLAVRIDNKDNADWSILDKEGRELVKEEYDSDDQVSYIFGDSYWVRTTSTVDGRMVSKFSLYHIDNPRKPVSDVEYDHVTEMYHNRALVGRVGQPIKILNEQGGVVATLPTAIVEAQFNYSPFYVFKKNDGRYGWMDCDGKVVNEGLYKVFSSIDGTVLAQSKEDGKWKVFDKDGKELGQLSAEKILAITSDNIVVSDKDDEVMLVGNKGEVKHKFKRSVSGVGQYLDGYAEFCNDKGRYGIVSADGEETVRAKYDGITALSPDRYVACDDDEYGILNAEGEEVLPFDYDNIFFFRIGDNYIVQEGRSYSIINEKGESLGEDFHSYSLSCTDFSIRYYDMSGLAADIAKMADELRPGDTAAAVARRFGITAGSSMSYSYDIESEVPENIGGHDVKPVYTFNGFVARQMSHEEEYEDFWGYKSTRIVYDDAYEWTDAELSSLSFAIPLDGLGYDDCVRLLQNALNKLGYQLNFKNQMFINANDRRRHISFSDKVYGSITVVIQE